MSSPIKILIAAAGIAIATASFSTNASAQVMSNTNPTSKHMNACTTGSMDKNCNMGRMHRSHIKMQMRKHMKKHMKHHMKMNKY